MTNNRNNQIKFIQVNLHHAKGATAVLCRRFINEKIGVALLQEPWANKGEVLGIPSHNSIKLIYDENSTTPRTAIMVSQDIKFTPITQFITKDIVAIRMEIPTSRGSTEAFVASAYFPGDEEPVPRVIAEFISYCKTNNKQFVIGCDANAHHTIWGSSDINDRGEYLLEYLSMNNIDLCNKGESPTFVTRLRQEVLDLTLCSPRTSANLKNWHVSTEESLSDHKQILFELNVAKLSTQKYRNPRYTNWENYKDNLENTNFLPNDKIIRNTEQLDEVARNMTDGIIQTYEDNCPLKQKETDRDVDWWNNTLEELRVKTRQAWNNAKSTDDWESYRKILTNYNKEIRKAKRKTWKSFCESIESTPETAKLQKVLSKDHSNGLGNIRKADGSFTVDTTETLEVMLETHFPGSILTTSARSENSESVAEGYKTIETVTTAAKNLADSIFTQSKVEWAVASFEPFKASGSDRIFPALLQNGGAKILETLTEICKASFLLRSIPMTWRKVKVIFIPKPGKKDKTIPKAFRPISLTSTLLKIMEKIIYEHVTSTTMQNEPLNRFQFAYQSNKSTVTALHELVTKVEKTISNKEIALAAFLDIEGAFDNASYSSIKTALRKRNFDPYIIGWIMTMLYNREVIAELSGTSITVKTTRGCPQGGVLSPLLWSLVVDALLNKLIENGFEVIGFADDVVIICRGKFDHTLSERMQTALNMTHSWCLREGLSINPSKTVVVPFTRRRKVTLTLLRLNDTTLTYSSQVKYLGVTLDSKLNWNAHLEQVLNKATSALWLTKKTCGMKWGLRPKMIHWIYTVVIRPRITYASLVWWPKTEEKIAQQKLAKIQRLACMAITGAMRSTPSKALDAMLNLLQLHQFIKDEAKASAIRLQGINNMLEGQFTGHLAILKNVLKEPLMAMNEDWIQEKLNLDISYKMVEVSRQTWSSGGPKISPGTVIFYTDGSKTEEGTGAGITGPGINIAIPMGKWSTVFITEIYAILECAAICLKRNYRHASISIFSDSQAALKALTSKTCQSRLVWECSHLLKQLSKKNLVKLYWVPGHCDIEGNEKADALARQGSGGQFIGPEPFCGVSRSIKKAKIKENQSETIKNNWKLSQSMRQSKLFITPDKRKTDKLLNLSKKSLSTIVGLFTGHCPCRYHLKKLLLVQSDICRFCDSEKETAEHLLCNCGVLFTHRQKHLERGLLSPNEIQLVDPNKIVNFIHEIIPNWGSLNRQGGTVTVSNGNRSSQDGTH